MKFKSGTLVWSIDSTGKYNKVTILDVDYENECYEVIDSKNQIWTSCGETLHKVFKDDDEWLINCERFPSDDYVLRSHGYNF